MKYLIVLLSLAVAIGRMFIVPRLTNIPSTEGAYEALAHLFVGFLIIVPLYDPKESIGPSRLYALIGWILAFWEAGWFFAQRSA